MRVPEFTNLLVRSRVAELTNLLVRIRVAELTDFFVRRRVVDGNLMAKWKKPGYEVPTLPTRDHTNAYLRCVWIVRLGPDPLSPRTLGPLACF